MTVYKINTIYLENNSCGENTEEPPPWLRLGNIAKVINYLNLQGIEISSVELCLLSGENKSIPYSVDLEKLLDKCEIKAYSLKNGSLKINFGGLPPTPLGDGIIPVHASKKGIPVQIWCYGNEMEEVSGRVKSALNVVRKNYMN